MRLALDTNRYTDLMAGLSEVVDTVESAMEIFVPFPVLGELRAGFASGARSSMNEKSLAAFLNKPFVKSLYADDQTVGIYALLASDLRSRGRAIPHNDLWIASLCVQHGLSLYSRDKHFNSLPQVARV